ncbi:MAG: DegT/DnrJ/EryC1/StrS family aminotransferase [Clostridiaceae bacterium]
MTIQITRSSMPDLEEYMQEISVLWENRVLTNMGIKHKQLEEELKRYLNIPDIVLFNNGHIALEYAIDAMELTGEIITTPYTFASTTNAIVRCGLVPIFCDINEQDYTMDASKIESLITDKTSAIIPVHVYGNVCDVAEIEKIALKHGLKVLYDAAHAFGVTVGNKSVAEFGNASMFSFHATKVFNTIEGGAITTKDARLAQKLNLLKNYGLTGPESVEYPGGNAKMNEFQAAMGLCNLKHVEGEILKRKAVVERYRENLSGVKGIKLCSEKEGVKSNYAYFPAVFKKYKYSRDEIFEKLKAEDIFSRKYFYPLTSTFGYFNGRFDPNDTPVAKLSADSVLTLPLYAGLSMEDVDRICRIISA